ncbi:MAG: hypothetical protein FWF15_09265 [Oscillospiraceae bacterium]|nr:hypothetical protein [Oscillospiraceae bacterium]
MKFVILKNIRILWILGHLKINMIFITKVYYLIGDFSELSKLSDKGLAETTKDAVLIWEK